MERLGIALTFAVMRQYGWKIITVLLLIYTFIAGFLVPVPFIGNLYHTIRNLFFHVPMWFGQMILLLLSLIYSIAYLRKNNEDHDIAAKSFAVTGIIYGLLGLITGAIWANFTWGEPWSNDPKQIAVAIALLIYLAYFVLRNSMPDPDKRARVAAVYNVFAYFMYIPLIMILPRLVESLHPGGKGVEGNPALSGQDLDPTMRLVFWPAVIGWTLLGVWITQLYIRYWKLKLKQ
jgi:heme exporter protein C